jgi:hypothetical protein
MVYKTRFAVEGLVNIPDFKPESLNKQLTTHSILIKSGMAKKKGLALKSNCQRCGKEYIKRRWWSKFCSPECRNADWVENHPRIK